jgi:hypothetical protein
MSKICHVCSGPKSFISTQIFEESKNSKSLKYDGILCHILMLEASKERAFFHSA